MVDAPKVDKPKTDDDEKILEPDEVVFDAVETAMMQDATEREDAKK